MHALMQTTVMDRLVERITDRLFDPDLISSTTLPLVIDDGPFTGQFERDITYDFGETDDVIPICLLFFCLIEDVQEDKVFWETMADAYLDGRLSPFTNLLYQFGERGLNFASDETVIHYVEKLYEDTIIECEVDVFGQPIYFLNRITSELFYSWMFTEPEYVLSRYEDLFRRSVDHLTDKVRVTTLWNRSANFNRGGASAYVYSTEYTAVLDCSNFPEETTYSNPYKGGGFSCMAMN